MVDSGEKSCENIVKSFVVDEMCGKLARWLRLLGFDTAYYIGKSSENMDDHLISIAIREDRTLLSKDTALVKRAINVGVEALLLRGSNTFQDLKQVLLDYLNCNKIKVKPRCPICNSTIEKIGEEVVKEGGNRTLYGCKKCGKVYWFGAHWKTIKRILEDIGVKAEISIG